MSALDGVRLLAWQSVGLHFDDEDVPRVAEALHATVVLLRERLRLLDCLVRDKLDPAIFLANENRADHEPSTENRDMRLSAWSEKKTVRRLRREVERAQRRIDALLARRAQEEQPTRHENDVRQTVETDARRGTRPPSDGASYAVTDGR